MDSFNDLEGGHLSDLSESEWERIHESSEHASICESPLRHPTLLIREHLVSASQDPKCIFRCQIRIQGYHHLHLITKSGL